MQDRQNKQRFIVCTISEDGARVSAVSDLRKSFSYWRSVGRSELPVACWLGDRDVFTRVARLIRLPISINLNRAAEIFGNLGVCNAAQPAVFREVHRLGGRAAVLLRQWQDAVAHVDRRLQKFGGSFYGGELT